ncbi:hypothetical protein D1006_35065 [Burkholderia stabilis]|uniref:Uncharacterized protein n=1 Tax=Burkholderia stabilis TaxID=95485 RepID=A0A4Q2A7D5_9BURK|nr:hypothetical protein [Burkholderia stabilis]RXV65326.1 hypothetical protein D1006_35065 [Burkholderia stabilis]
MAGIYQSVDELVRWFAQEPRTLGWDAFMALDRSKTNLLLQQEYIERFGGNDYIAPITGISPLTGAIQQLVGYRFDKPRVSFENASLRDGKVKMTLRAVSGSFLKWEGDASVARLTEITQVDPLAGHTFTSTIELRDDRLALDKLEVVLDLKDGRDPTLTTTRYEQEQELTGTFIQARFAAMAREQTRFALSRLSYHDGDLIRPEKIKILSQSASGTRVAPKDQDGDGAVLVFVKMVGGAEGHIPGEGPGWTYMLNPGTHSALMVLSNTFVMQNIVGDAFTQFKGPWTVGSFRPVFYDAGKFKRVGTEGGSYWHYNDGRKMYAIPFSMRGGHDGYNGYMNGNVYIGSNGINLSGNWEGTYYYNEDYVGGTPRQVPFVENWEYAAAITNNEVRFVRVSHVAEGLPSHINFISHMSSVLQKVNTAPLANLLFSSEVPLQLKDVKVPGDMLIFGDINPELTTFTLTEPEVSLIAGGTYTFKWSGSTTPTFTLEWADGSGELGSFSGATYTAPRTLPAGRTFVRVRVKARAGSATSYALVTVGARPVSVNPLVQLSMTGASAKPLLTAGAFDGAAVTFTSSKGGSFVVQDNGQAEYTASSFTGPVLIDTITAATGGGQKAECTVVTYTQNHYNMVVMRDGSDFDAGKVLLSKDGGTFEVAPQALTWAVLEGDGSVEATDVATKFIFNAGAPSAAGFYLLQLEGGDDFGKNYSYVLLPGDLSLLKTPLA